MKSLLGTPVPGSKQSPDQPTGILCEKSEVWYSPTVIHVNSHGPLKALALYSLLPCSKTMLKQFEGYCFLLRLTLSLPSSKTIHSPNLPKENCISEVVWIGSIIIFHLSKRWKVKFSVLCDVYFWWGCRRNVKMITLGGERVKEMWLPAVLSDQDDSASCYLAPHTKQFSPDTCAALLSWLSANQILPAIASFLSWQILQAAGLWWEFCSLV